jgi:hypothetical protein
MQPGTSAVVAALVAFLGVAAVAVLVVLAASGDSVHPVSESTKHRSLPPIPSGSAAGPTSQRMPTASPPPGWTELKWPEWLEVLAQAAILTAGAIVALLLLWLIVRKAADIASAVKVPQGLSHDAATSETVVSPEQLARGIDTSLAAVNTGTPSNAIVACWLALEQTAALAGVPRRATETPSEFTVRVLAAAAVSEPVLGRLADLYREARFSQHDLSESARTEAREALAVLRAQLDASREAE